MNPLPDDLDFARRLGAIRPDRWGAALGHVARLTAEGNYPDRAGLDQSVLPAELNGDEAWTVIELGRRATRVEVGLVDASARPLSLSLALPLGGQRLLHELDRHRADSVRSFFTGNYGDDSPGEARFAVKARWAEAIATSRLAGLELETAPAVEFLREARAARSDAERSLASAEAALELVGTWGGEPFSPGKLIELQRGLHGVAPARVGRRSGVVAEDELSRRLDGLCRFLNAEPPTLFLHPLVRASIAHFWLLQVRPFPAANGRTARALVYWAMARAGYPQFACLALSPVLAAAPSDYAMAVERVAADAGDVTAFVVLQLRAVEQAIASGRAELARAGREARTLAAPTEVQEELNPRQIALLAHAARHPGARYGIEAHRRSHGITFPTASADLFDLLERGWLAVAKEGRVHVFTPARPGAGPRERTTRRPRPVSRGPERGPVEPEFLPVNLL